MLLKLCHEAAAAGDRAPIGRFGKASSYLKGWGVGGGAEKRRHELIRDRLALGRAVEPEQSGGRGAETFIRDRHG